MSRARALRPPRLRACRSETAAPRRAIGLRSFPPPRRSAARRAPFSRSGLGQRRIVAVLVLAAENHPQAAGKRGDRLQRRIHVGGFRIVVPGDAVRARARIPGDAPRPGNVITAARICACVAPARRAIAAAAMVFSRLCTPRRGTSAVFISGSPFSTISPLREERARRDLARRTEPDTAPSTALGVARGRSDRRRSAPRNRPRV